ncbi:MAG: ABC transporter permease [Bacteroidetes bacterium]|nr:ABC transporter permease [Bacteroidota bacterium]
MRKIFLIIKREYLTRVRKKSFVVMTILGPILMAAIIVIPIYVSTITNEVKTISVLDETGIFPDKFKDSNEFQFRYLNGNIDSLKKKLTKTGDYALLYIPKPHAALPAIAFVYSESQINISAKSYIRNVMVKEVENLKLEAKLKDLNPQGLDSKITKDDIMASIKADVSVNTIRVNDEGEEKKSYTEVSMVLGFVGAFLIYLFIFLFGAQVMRGVIEEKTNRIVEVIVSSVKPFELMMGKIIGIALIGLTQFMLWVVLTFGIVTVATISMADQLGPKGTQEILKQQTPIPGGGAEAAKMAEGAPEVNEILEAINTIDFGVMFSSFLFYFLFGYLLYAALFAAIGSAVDNEADTQQFMLPLTLPLIFAIIMAQFIIQDPESPLAFWLSIIPFTSPVVMMIRIPFGVPMLDICLSVTFLILGFLGATWMAGKIYRTGILMYGKKVNYRELWKWLRY